MKNFALFAFILIFTVTFLLSFSPKDAKSIVMSGNSGSSYSLEDYRNDNPALFSVEAMVEKVVAARQNFDNFTTLLVADSTVALEKTSVDTAQTVNAPEKNVSMANDPLGHAIKDNASKVYDGFRNLFKNGVDKPSANDKIGQSDQELLNGIVQSISDNATKVYKEFRTLITDSNAQIDNLTANDNVTKSNRAANKKERAAKANKDNSTKK